MTRWSGPTGAALAVACVAIASACGSGAGSAATGGDGVQGQVLSDVVGGSGGETASQGDTPGGAETVAQAFDQHDGEAAPLDVEQDAVPDLAGDVPHDAGEDTAHDAGSDAGPDAGPDAGDEAGGDDTAGAVSPPEDVTGASDAASPDDVAAPEDLASPDDAVPPEDVTPPEDLAPPEDTAAPDDVGAEDAGPPDLCVGLVCDDGNPCTDDGCDGATGCTAAPNSAACDDGNPCTGPDACKAGACAGPPASCDDANVCTDDACDVVEGCLHVSNAAPCNDGNACTLGDACTSGSCAGGTPKGCNDSKSCTVDSCSPMTGCVNALAAVGTPCDDGDGCTTPDACDAAGYCKGPAVKCVPGPCQLTGVCIASSGQCAFSPKSDGTFCNDSDSCTTGDVCKSGTCVGSGHSMDIVLGVGTSLEAFEAAVLPATGGMVFGGWIFKSSLYDGWLTRLADGGAADWDNIITAGTATDRIADVVETTGGFVFAGSTSSKGAGQEDAWIGKRDPTTGGALWDKVYGGTATDRLDALVALPDGTFAAAGLTASAGIAVSTGGDFLLLRVDKDGNELWKKAYGGAQQDYAHAIVALSDGGFALVGYTFSKGAGGSDYWLVRTDAAGAPLWDKTFGGTGNEEAHGTAALPGDGLVLVGSTTSKGAGQMDGWVVRVDAAGGLAWDKTFGGTQLDAWYHVLGTDDGGLLTVGQGGSGPYGAGDGWVVRTDGLGNVQWERYAGGSKPDTLYVAAAKSGYGLVIAGSNASKTGEQQAWLKRLDFFGNDTCGDPDICLGTGFGTCDDSDPCTADGCAKGTGCKHTKLPDGAPCGGGKTCTGGVCG